MEVNCPTCKKTVTWGEQSPFRPFCSKRCQLIDLGEWSNEQMAISGESNQPKGKPSSADIEEIEAMLAQQSTDFFKQ
ncbi:DNA gyrase inhibitor YacG [Aliiglaciecola litoralis]|uniref:DNA gyrase inhibitor YacG n=1 Tax=Aliiglaciecola litoralis TaxID=582857 RepID=A0ABN1LQM8_9ALTE